MNPYELIPVLVMFWLVSLVAITFAYDYVRYLKRPWIVCTNLYVNKLQEERIPAKPVSDKIPMVYITGCNMDNMYV